MEEVFDLAREFLRLFFAVIKRVLHEVTQLLVVVARIVQISRPLAIGEASHCLAQETWLLHSLSFSLLSVLLL